ncbi:MAG TPA: hypothetical protein VH720_08920 [Candidatus Limnocylindrales bacterium]|jgi:hypothetical protein
MDDDRSPAQVRYYGWRWGPDEERRPGLPWIGIFLVVFGGLLLIQQALPDAQGSASLIVLAAGIASLIAWGLRRGTITLYAGAFLTALALPGTYEGLTRTELGPGWGTVAFGLAFLAVAVIRASRGGGWGWQLFWGGILVLVGGSQVAKPEAAGLIWPILVVLVGLVILAGGLRRPA